MAATTTSAPDAETRRVASEIIDSDVHVMTPQGLRSIWHYFTTDWQKHLAAKGVGIAGSAMGASAKSLRFSHPTGAAIRKDAVGPNGGPAGSDFGFVCSDLLEGWQVDYAIINAIDAGTYAAGLANPDEATAICEAFNRYYIEQWAGVDQRFKYLLTVNPQDPPAAAREIRERGALPEVFGIFLPVTNILLGNRHHYPIYEAAAELGLPIWTHITGIEFIHQGSPLPTGSHPESYAERRCMSAQIAEGNLVSIVMSGVLERFPGLRFCFSEFGFSWILPLMWRMDDTWRACRPDTPWVKKPPSEYVHESIRFTTQPLDEPAQSSDLFDVIRMMGSDLLLFSTDYPHWDNDNPHRVMKGWPDTLREEVCSTNPRKFWGL